MGHAQNKRERIEAAMQLLQFAPEGLTIYELADRLGCDPSTAHRYLTEIESERPLEKVSRGRYRLDPSQSLHNVRLHPAEALSMYIALRRLIRQTSKAPDFMITAIQKIAPALQRPDLVEMLYQSIAQLHSERKMSERDSGVWKALMQGWLENRVVRIRYLRPHQTEMVEHEIEPYWFEPAPLSDGTYVIAWSRTRNSLRTFKPDRIHQATLTSTPFEKPDQFDLLNLLRNAWGIWYGEEPTLVELRFVPGVARRVMETVFHPTERKEPLEDGSLYWSAQLVGTREVLSWIRGWGYEVRVLAPEKLRQEVIEDLRKTMAVYEE
jgi:CRISPR-associated endonuclease/helicase Cas3